MFSFSLSATQRQSLAISWAATFTALLLLTLLSLLSFILIRGGSYFWPNDIQKMTLQTPQGLVQVYAQGFAGNDHEATEWNFYHYDKQLETGGLLSVEPEQIQALAIDFEASVVELKDGRKLLATIIGVSGPDGESNDIAQYSRLADKVNELDKQIDTVRQGELANIHQRLAEMDRREVALDAPARIRYSARFDELQRDLEDIQVLIAQYRVLVKFADGVVQSLPMVDVAAHYQPSPMSWLGKTGRSFIALWTFVSQSPKQNNQAGGVFPALFGTILMVLLMTIFVTPLGVLAAVYLNEYAPQNKFTSLIRIAVNNLAGVPSVVYGVFGLGFFVYTLGGSLDKLIFGNDLGAPVFGAPGLFWASLTMAILTLPVVIVATEEGLRRVPDSLRKGSYALGATQAETVLRTVLPIASPGIMTGIILAIARGAGEVAPLMLVGAVKFAPALPIDGEFPYVHFQRQFMHLGVMVYDGAFHSENFGSGASFMFASCLFLLLIVFVLNLLAIGIRNRLRRQYGQQ